MHQINFPTEKKIINEDEKLNLNNILNRNSDDINLNLNINESSNINSNNDNNITFKAKPAPKFRDSGDDFLFDSKIKNKKLNEYSMFLDEKINDLKKRLNLNNISSQ